jgi:hypothetical protein
VSGPVDLPCALAVWGVFSAPPVAVPMPHDARAVRVPGSTKRVRRDPKDLTGKRLGALVVRGRADVGARLAGRLWLLDCDCGSTCTETAEKIARRERTSCSRSCPLRNMPSAAARGGVR